MTQNEGVNRNRRGWSFFTCEECGQEWKLSTRDALSPSCDGCTNCYAMVSPHKHELDPGLRVDNMLNLIDPIQVIILTPGRPNT